MAAQLTEYVALLGRLRDRRDKLLPPENATAKYTDTETLHMLAFRVLVHAEVESFIEDVATALLDVYTAKHLLQGGLPTWAREHFTMHLAMRQHYPPRTVTYTPTPKEEQQIRGFLSEHASVIDGNNGASEKDVLKLFVPLGFPVAWFSPAWLRSMTTLGIRRGEVAHNSSSSITVLPTPEDEKTHLIDPLLGLRHLVREADRLIANL